MQKRRWKEREARMGRR